ncbi:MAG: hypothetical protein OQJ89_00580 [Kangiellaceae bacterium]|nr:hypothetical protein [Kangiellaceae bacterium]MCW8998286.1 hypothetical protein [Kangiellaceae bacterium]MCW9015435.1 hypothetical protein [Kangiellaceae bacterium]
MKPIILLKAICILLFSQSSFSVDTNVEDRNIEQLIVAENIELKSQQIAKLYFYIHYDVLAKSSKAALSNSLQELRKNITQLKIDDESGFESGLREFMLVTHSELADAVKLPYSVSNANLILDYSETYLEVAEHFVTRNLNNSSRHNTNLTKLKRMALDVERANKYYIAMYAGHADRNTLNQVSMNISGFEKKLEDIADFNYEGNAKHILNELVKHWKISKPIYQGKKINMPIFVLASTRHLESALENLANYHRIKLQSN